MMGELRRALAAPLLRALSSRGLVRLLAATGRGGCVVLVLHRFANPDLGIPGHCPVSLRALLARLRHCGVQLVDAERGIDEEDGWVAPDRRRGVSVAFTVDDGYQDLIDIAAPVFAEFDCPVSSFVVPDVVDGCSWFWWDRLDWLLRHATRPALSLDLGQGPIEVAWTDEPSRVRARERLEGILKALTQDESERVIGALAIAAEVEIPTAAPHEYRTLDWAGIRSAERRGIRFGPHSLSHPILSRCSAEQATREIVGSISRVHAQLTDPIRIFCYPNGNPEDFGLREYEAIESAGYRYAFSTIGGVIRPTIERDFGPDWRLRLPRFPYEDNVGRILKSLI